MKTWLWSRWVLVVMPVVMALAVPGCADDVCSTTNTQDTGGTTTPDLTDYGDCEEGDDTGGEAGAGGFPDKAAQGVAGPPEVDPEDIWD